MFCTTGTAIPDFIRLQGCVPSSNVSPARRTFLDAPGDHLVSDNERGVGPRVGSFEVRYAEYCRPMLTFGRVSCSF